MKSGIARRLALVAVAGAAGLVVACASDPVIVDDVRVNPNTEDYVSRMSAEGETPRVAPEEIPARDEASTSEVASRNSRIVKGQSGNDELKRLADYYANQAAREYANKRYEEAAQYAGDALTMDPKNALAAQIKADSDVMLGQGRSQAENMARARSQEEAAKRAEALYEIGNRIKTAEGMLRQGRYTEAIAELEVALDVIRWTSYMVETEAYEREARLMLQEAQTLREQARLEDYVKIREQERRLRELEIQQELDRYREDVKNFYQQAQDYFDRREYREAVVVLDKILREDPYNEEVARLKQIATSLENGRRDRQAWEQYNHNWRETMHRIAASAYMPTNDLTLPTYEHWRMVNERAARVREQGRTKLSKEDITVRSALETVSVLLEYEDADLADVVARFRAEGRINIVMSSAVRQADVKLTIAIGRVQLRQALNLVSNQTDLSWRVENGAVIIDEQDAAMGKNAITQVFQVADLLVNLRTFKGDEPRLSGDTTEERSRIELEEPDIDEDPVTIEDLQEVIEAAVDPESWGQEGHGITYRQQDLIVRNNPENIDRVEALLDDLRSSQGLTVSIEARFITIRDDFLEDIGVDFRGVGGAPQIPPPGIPPVPAALDDVQFGNNSNPAGPGGTGNDAGFFFQDMPPSGNVRSDQRIRIENLFDQSLGGRRGNVGLTGTGGMAFQLAFVDNPEINAILRAVRKRERATLLTAPRVTVHNTQRAHVSVMNELAYIRDFDTNTATGIAVADPVVDVIRDGIVLDVRPTISADRRYVTLELRPTLATLLRPIPTFTTSLGVGTPVAIQTPQLTLQRIRTTITVPDGGSFVIGGLRQMSETDQTSGIPILSDLPLIGALFTRKGKSIIRQDIIIIVSARIIDIEEEEDYSYRGGPGKPR
jgi:type II secretory pathway component GspD/PulD (secretin)